MKPMNNKASKGFTPIIVLVIIVLLGVGGLLVFQNRDTTHVNQAQVQIPINTERPDSEVGSSSWKTYRNDEVGFMLSYPTGTALITKNVKADDGDSINLYIAAQKISEFKDDSPQTLKEEAILDRENLANGKCQLCDQTHLVELIKLDGVNARSNISWVGLDICSPRILKEVVVYQGDYRITLVIAPLLEKVINENSSYFEDSLVCGHEIYTEGAVEKLYSDLANGTASKSLTNWWNTSGQILSTFKFLE